MNQYILFPLNMALGLVALSFVACATSASREVSVGPPHEWIAQFDDKGPNCSGMLATFSNRGEKYAGENKPVQDGLLGEAVLLIVLPGGAVSDSIVINANVSSGAMMANLIGVVERKEEFEISCEQGWLRLAFSRRGQYLGESVVEKQFDQVSYLRQGNAGELIARVIVDADFNSHYFFNSKLNTEDWYRFQPAR